MKLITDRTEADVLLGTAKGCYRCSDLNRVEQAVAEICTLCAQIGIYPNLSTKTDWGHPGVFSKDSWPTEVQMLRYINNVTDLCASLDVDSSKVPKSVDNLDWSGANAIEEALQRAYQEVIERIEAS